jgi:hypothetical protein
MLIMPAAVQRVRNLRMESTLWVVQSNPAQQSTMYRSERSTTNFIVEPASFGFVHQAEVEHSFTFLQIHALAQRSSYIFPSTKPQQAPSISQCIMRVKLTSEQVVLHNQNYFHKLPKSIGRRILNFLPLSLLAALAITSHNNHVLVHSSIDPFTLLSSPGNKFERAKFI